MQARSNTASIQDIQNLQRQELQLKDRLHKEKDNLEKRLIFSYLQEIKAKKTELEELFKEQK